MASILAYNLGKLCRRLVLPERTRNWLLTKLQQGLAKTGGRVVKHAHYYSLEGSLGYGTQEERGIFLKRVAVSRMALVEPLQKDDVYLLCYQRKHVDAHGSSFWSARAAPAAVNAQ